MPEISTARALEAILAESFARYAQKDLLAKALQHGVPMGVVRSDGAGGVRADLYAVEGVSRRRTRRGRCVHRLLLLPGLHYTGAGGGELGNPSGRIQRQNCRRSGHD